MMYINGLFNSFHGHVSEFHPEEELLFCNISSHAYIFLIVTVASNIS